METPRNIHFAFIWAWAREMSPRFERKSGSELVNVLVKPIPLSQNICRFLFGRLEGVNPIRMAF